MVAEDSEVQTDAEVTEPSSEAPQESTKEASVDTKVETETEKPKEEPLPFHEHPRFKELVEQKNQYSQQAKALQDQIAQMREELHKVTQPKTVDKRTQMIERLKTIDPEFAEFVSELAPVEEIKRMQAEHAERVLEQTRSQAVNAVKDLHTQYKVDPKMQDLYNVQLEIAASRNPNLRLSDVPALYKTVHENMSKLVDDIKRTERETYLAAKKKDASIPATQPKGKAVKSGSEIEYSKDPGEARQQMVRRILNMSKAAETN